MNFPADLHYTREHEWVKAEAPECIVGVTDFAQKSLGEITYLELPRVGREVKQGEALAVVESVKAVSDIYSPLSGKVLAVNEKLLNAPGLLNTDPYGEGWMVRLSLANPAELVSLLDAQAYARLVEEA